MSGKSRVSAIPPAHQRASKVRKPTSKELDLLLLASCSCLLTMLYHPVAQALQTHTAQNANTTAIAQTSTQPTTTAANAFHLITPAREEVTEEEDS